MACKMHDCSRLLQFLQISSICRLNDPLQYMMHARLILNSNSTLVRHNRLLVTTDSSKMVRRAPSSPAITPVNTTSRPSTPNLLQIFQAIDSDHSGRISAQELQQALSNGTWRPFNAETCRLLIAMFDQDNDGGISFNEFQALWDYINAWCRTFRRYDTDNSGNIDRSELMNALTQFGYRLSGTFYDLLMRRFDRNESERLNFDDFVQLCIVLQTLTAAFRTKDTDRDGWIRIHYEEFLTMVLQAKI